MFASLGRAWRRFTVALGYVPNVDWLRARLNRAVTLDRARAHLAIAACERAIRLRRAGIPARCFGPLGE